MAIDAMTVPRHARGNFVKQPLLLSLLAAFLVQNMPMAANLEESVVQIMTYRQIPDWDRPWRPRTVDRISGTGFVIDGERILTNAHVVAWARQILVRKYQDARPWPARVVFHGHDCDLAVLEVDGPGFFLDAPPLDLGDLPAVRSTVVTYGYPAGGEQISYTRGVVSRIELQTYTHQGNRRLLAVQTDAAINPGNSGGPVIQEERVVGVAFQGISGLENTGFFIPSPVFRHFLEDIEDGAYNGFPMAGISIAPLQNPAQRAYLGLEEDVGGARISALNTPESRKHLRRNDVVLQVGEWPIARDGSILYRGNQLHGALAFSLAQEGRTVPLRLLRDGVETRIELPVLVDRQRPQASRQYTPPRYCIYAGLVFTPLSHDFLSARGGNSSSRLPLVHELHHKWRTDPEEARTEPVVLASVLAHPVNVDMNIRGAVLVDRINGVRIDRLEDVIGALEGNDGDWHTLEFAEPVAFETLDRKKADLAHHAILRTYSIMRDRRL